MERTPSPDREQIIQDLLGEVTWADIARDGFTTIREIEVAMRAKGIDPYGDDD